MEQGLLVEDKLTQLYNDIKKSTIKNFECSYYGLETSSNIIGSKDLENFIINWVCKILNIKKKSVYFHRDDFASKNERVNYLKSVFTVYIDLPEKQARVSLYLEELGGNCSSCTIHHLNISDYGDIFNQDKMKAFLYLMECIVLYVYKYTCILYTISNETTKWFSDFVKDTSKFNVSFRNSRNKHIIEYYTTIKDDFLIEGPVTNDELYEEPDDEDYYEDIPDNDY